MMKKLLAIVGLGFFFNGNANAETWTCENDRFGKVIYEVKDSTIELKYPNGDGRAFEITKDKRKYYISVFGENRDKKNNFDFDIYMDYKEKYVINRTLDTITGFSNSYRDKNCIIF